MLPLPRPVLALALAAVAALAVACGDAHPAPSAAPNADSQTLPPRAVPTLPPCPSPAPPVAVPEGLVLPEGAVVFETATQGPLTTARGFVPAEPVDVHDFYAARPDLELVTLEEEGFEAEVLYGDSDLRVYVKARIACEGGSAFSAVVGNRGASVPTPAGSPSPVRTDGA